MQRIHGPRARALVVVSGVVAATVVATGSPATGAHASPLASAPAVTGAMVTLPSVTTDSADSFVDSVGVVTHFRYTDQAYGQSTRLLESLKALGVHHIRDGFAAETPTSVIDVFKSLPEYGLKATIVVGSAGSSETLPTGTDALASVTALGIRDSVEAIESANEWDQRVKGDGWLPEIRTFQAQLYAAVKGNAEWSDVPVVGPSTGQKSHLRDLVGLGDDMDIANVHNYPAGSTPESVVPRLATAMANAPGKPLYVTETGYHTALNQTRAQKPVDDQAKADYLVRLLLENYRAGAARTYIYQLVDGKPDTGDTDQEQHFGLLRNDYSETPAYQEIQSLLASMTSGAATAGLAVGKAGEAAPTLTVSSDDQSVQQLAFHKDDGSTVLVLWRRGTLYANGQDTPLPPASVQVGLGSQGRQVARFQAGKVTELGAGGTIQGTLGDQPLVLQVGQTGGLASQSLTLDATGPLPTSAAPAVSPSTGGSAPVALIGGGVLVVLVLAGGGFAMLRRRRRA